MDFDKLDVYQAARRLNAAIAALLRTLPRGRWDLVDQLRRAAVSVLLNIAEGAGEFAVLEKVRFYRIAKRSADEVAAALDLLVDYGLATEAAIALARAETERVAAMLVRMILRLQNPEATTRSAARHSKSSGSGRARSRSQAPAPSPQAGPMPQSDSEHEPAA